ncbi:MAG: hypothetical protein H0V90_07795 [Blastocatellia bacterium]|nr:hypothetical protein [Blastocatellia bacterium]
MIRIVKKAISLANAPALTEIELGDRARDWAEVLFDVVPEEHLQDAFKRAARDHKTSFPVSMHDVRIAYEQIAADELREEKRLREKFLDDLDAERKLSNRFECKLCFGSGWKEITEYDSVNRPYKGVIKCHDCRHWEYYSEKLKQNSTGKMK